MWERLEKSPGGFRESLNRAARKRHGAIVERLPQERERGLDSFAIDGYLPLKSAAKAAGVSEADAAEFVRRGLWTYRVIAGMVYARPALVSTTAVAAADSAA